MDASRYIISDHEKFEAATFAAKKDTEGVTITAEPDSAHPFSVAYSWVQFGEFFRTAAQLHRDVEREAEEAWERDIAENMEAYDALDHHRDVYLKDTRKTEDPLNGYISDARKQEFYNYRLHFDPDQGYLLMADSDKDDDLIIRNFTMVGSQIVLHGVQEMGFEALTAMREKLNELYDAYVKENGTLSSADNKKRFGRDADYPILQSLENYNAQTQTYEKADIFFRRTVSPVQEIKAVETCNELFRYDLGHYTSTGIVNNEMALHRYTSQSPTSPSTILTTTCGNDLKKIVYSIGDVDRDGDVDLTDKQLILKYIAKLMQGNTNRTNAQKELDKVAFCLAADCNEDGVIDVNDVNLLSSYLNNDPNVTL